jgi:immune inhibitor A
MKGNNNMFRKLTVKSVLIAAILIYTLALPAIAVPPSPDIMEKLKSEGKLDAFMDKWQEAKLRGLDSPIEAKSKNSLAKVSDGVDTVRVLILLVDFSDKPYTAGYTAAMPSNFDSVLFSTERKNPTGSMTEYYLENSYGKFYIKGDVYGWFRMPQLYSYYSPTGTYGIGNYPNNCQKLTEDAINAADATIDFSPYDSWGPDGYPDGEVDGIFIVHSGTGFEESGLETDIHSHKWSMVVPLTKDGVTLYNYTAEPEESYVSRTVSPIGVFCHEYGHFIGLPDLYDIDYTPSTSKGLGNWSLMAMGSYNNNSKTPAHLDAYCKMAAKFVTPIDVHANVVDVSFPQIESEPVIYRLWAMGIYQTQYFLVENRQKVGFDQYIPWSGLLIYHVDDNAGDAWGNNTDYNHYHVALEQADGLKQLEYTENNYGDAGDPWPGSSGKRSFDDLTYPNSQSYNHEQTQVSVWNITDSDSLMTANLDVRWSRPYFALNTAVFSDADHDDVLEAGETVQFFFEIADYWMTVNDVVVTLTCNDPDIIFTRSTANYPLIYGDNNIINNLSLPFEFTIPDTLIPTYDSFYVTITAEGGLYQKTFGIEQQVGASQFLIVDDDRGAAYDTLYAHDLYLRKIPCEIWDKNLLGSPSGNLLSNYRVVFWYTGDSAVNYLQTADYSAMKQFLDNNGCLFLSGQGLAGEINTDDQAFLNNYLHCQYRGATKFSPYQDGIAGSPIGNGLVARYYSGANQVLKLAQHVIPINGAVPAFTFRGDTAGYYSALSYAGTFKVVYFNWGYEAIMNTSTTFAKRDTILANILNFFGAVATEINDGKNIKTLPLSFDLEQNYPNPFNPTTTINYALHNTSTFPVPNTVLKVFNLLGQEIRTLVDKKQMPGDYSVEWDGTDNMGHRVASGLYFYKLTRGADKDTRKMVLLK